VARFARLLFVSTGVALAVWLRPASIHLIDWTSAGPVRVALFAPLWQLWVALAIAVLVAAIALSPVVRCLTPYNPLALLWLWAIPYLPWMPDRAPALLALAGPLRWGIVALAVSGVAIAFAGGRPTDGSAPAAWRWSPGRRTIFAVSFALYLGFGLWSAAAVGPDADEPHYLVITQSLLRDHDLAIENNHTRGDYHEYFGGDLHPDFLRRGLNEVIYSIHAPGLPALLVPAYAVAGYRGAVVMLCLFGALAAVAVFDLSALLGGAAAGWIAWSAVCLTVPFVPHAWLIFPEMPGALIVAWSALWLQAPLPPRARTWIWRGLALAILPWLHTKMVILLAAMGAALLLRLWRSPKAAAALVTPGVVSVALWLGSFRVLYGSFDPQIPYGDFPKFYVLFANIPRGVLGLLFDQKFGLLMYAPIYLIAIAGWWMMLRRTDLRWFALATLATVGAFVASSTRMYMWWGGSSAPARFLVPILPLAAPAIAIAFTGFRASAARASAALLLAVSLAVAAVGVASPQRLILFSAPHGLAKLVAAVQGASPLSYLLPTFTGDAVRAPLVLLAPWAIAGVLALAVLVALSRRRVHVSGFGAASAGLTMFLLGGAVLAGAPAPTDQRRATARRGRLEMMRAYDGRLLRGFDYTRLAKLTDRDVLSLSSVEVSRADGELASDPAHLAGPFDLPAGRFAAHVAFGRPATGDESVIVSLSDRTPIARGPADSEAPLAFDLPVDAKVWIAVSSGAMAAAVQQVSIAAESIVPRRARPDIDVHAIEVIGGRPGAFIVYADSDTYPEGGVFWTQGTHRGEVFIAPAGASMLVLTLHVGPIGGVVHLTVGGQDRSVTLTRDQTQQIEVPLPSSPRLVPVIVEAPGRFRPSDHEPGSADQRWLGCQVRVGLR
jgi:hypothetical protein